ncbi:hypothetical protein HF995_07565 [Sanguibacter hominis ATCC BAA-789]|uniref:Uncharacterized protein n=1 Tax=Sanguibacter hominis ATCC BAA-789 TaxID=1312740 RepID=A0A9X5FBH7_9MICO|nr:hypothetical protein [Sanguibacter hominis]NKX93129.1 hypothetical protein [Sanguibacter hominis ATCC BAA-789]
MVSALAASLVIFGTGAQAALALRALTTASWMSDALAVDELRSEVPWWRPLRWIRHRRLVKEIVATSPRERGAWKRTQWELRAWASLLMGAGFALWDAVFG